MKYVLTLLALASLAGCDINTPETGDKVGQIAKVQSAGVMCKTNEILVTGKFGGGELYLTVPDSLLARVKAANESQEFVKVIYHTNFLNATCNNETGNRWLDSVERSTANQP